MRLEKLVTSSQPLQSETYNKQLASKAIGTIEKSGQRQEMEMHDEVVINKENIETVISKLNEFISSLQTDIRFEYHDKLNDYYVTVINPITEQVIKEIPSKEMLDRYAAMAEFMGLLVDEKI